MAGNIVETIVKLRGSREFQAAAKQTAKSVLGIGDATEASGKQAGKSWKGVAQWAGGAAAIGGATAYLKDAASTTETLAKATMGLQRVTGMDTKAASEWAATLKVRGIDTGKFTVGMVALSRQMEAAKSGNKAALASFGALGVSMDDIRTGDTSAVLMSMADGFANMSNPAQKAATAQKLLGRQGQALLPLLNSGTAALAEQLKMADDYGATLDGSATDAVKEQIAAQRQWDMAMLGLKVQLGQNLLPALSQFSKALAGIVQFFQPLIRNSALLQGTIITLTAAFVAYKLATVAATLASMGLTRTFIMTKVATLASTVAMMGFNASLLLIPLAVAAIVIGIVVLYKKWGWFHRAVDNTFNWIKSHWKLLLVILTGPFGLAVTLIIRHFDKIRNAVRSIIDWLKRAFGDLKKFLDAALGKVKGALGKIPGANKVLGALAGGGPVTQTGPYLVGERGPEIVNLRAGSHVFPTPTVAPVGPNLEGAREQTVVTKVYLNRRQIAEAVGQYTADKKARR